MIWNETTRENYLEKLRHLAEVDMEAMAEETEKTNAFPEAFFTLAKESEVFRCGIPTEYGGYGLPDTALMEIQEAFSRGPGGMRMYLHYAMGMNWRILCEFGNHAQKAELLPKLASGEKFTCFVLTEETGGTGADLATKAEAVEGGYLLNGEKTLISWAYYADYAYVFAVTNPEGKKDARLSCLLVPLDSAGLTIAPLPTPMGCRGAGYGKLKFENVFVPQENLIGAEGEGLHIAVHSLAVSRAHVAVSNLGLCQRMLEVSIKRAKERITFGKPLATRQLIQGYLAEMGEAIYALRTMLYDFARDFDAGKEHHMKAAMAKNFSIHVTRVVSDNMLLIFGGIGYFQQCEYGPIERMYRDCRVTWLEEGPPTVLQATTAAHLLKNNGEIPCDIT